MNFYLIVFYFALFPCHLIAQHLKIADAGYNFMFASKTIKTWQTEKLKGRVKTCLVVDDTQDSTFYSYNKNGQLEKKENKRREEIYKFDSRKQLVKRTVQSINFDKNFDTTKVVDRLAIPYIFKEVDFFKKNGILEKKETNDNLANGWRIFETTYNYNAHTKELKQIYEHKLLADYGFKQILYKFEFDEQTKQIAKSISILEELDGAISYDTTTYIYDKELLVMRNQWGSCGAWDGECVGPSREGHIFVYDRIGNLLVRIYYDKTVYTSEMDGYSSLERFEYNGKNDVVKNFSYIAGGKEATSGEFLTYSMQEDQEPFITYFEYEYDKKGNWVVQKSFKKKDGKPIEVKITQRQIVYY